MSFANHNILDIALSIIPPTLVQIRKNLGTTVNKYGQSEATYGEWIEVYGIVQPGGEQNEHTEGIDFSKKHVTIWLRGVALDGTHIQWAPDQIRYVDRIYNVVGVTDWFPYDNYRQCDCVEVLNLPESQRSLRLAQIAQKAKQRALRNTSAPKETQPPPMQEAAPAPQNPAKEPDDAPQEPSAQPPKPSLVGKAIIRF